MANHADNDFRAAAKSLLDVVAPAIDPANPLARQQLKLVVDWLDFYRSRLPYNQDRERLELDSDKISHYQSTFFERVYRG